MPPRTKITKEMIVDAAFDIARESGVENINARSISERLGCSTQPVMWQFKRIADIRRAVYEKTDSFHTEYILNINSDNPMMDIGLNYIRFAATEKYLFRFLFQTNEFLGKSVSELTGNEEAMPLLKILSQQTQTNIEQAKRIFKSIFLYVHGYASILANNTMQYDEKEISKELELAFKGIVYAIRKGAETDETDI